MENLVFTFVIFCQNNVVVGKQGHSDWELGGSYGMLLFHVI